MVDQLELQLVGIDALHFVTSTQGWAMGGFGVIYATVNGGVTWTTEDSNTTSEFNGIFFTDPFHGWAVGDGGTIIARDLPASIEDGLPANGSIAIQLRQNYPNPVQSMTTIEYALPRDSQVRLSVYDLQGRLIARLADRFTLPANVVISNVPGPRQPLYFAGAKLDHYIPVSTIASGMGLNITVHSYEDKLDFGLVADRDLVPDLATILDSIHDEVAQLEARLL